MFIYIHEDKNEKKIWFLLILATRRVPVVVQDLRNSLENLFAITSNLRYLYKIHDFKLQNFIFHVILPMTFSNAHQYLLRTPELKTAMHS